MVRYLSLLSFTDKGILQVEKSLERADDFRNHVEAAGGRVLQQYWAVGEYDGCVVFEAPDDMTAATLLLKLGHADNVRSHTLRVFEASEFANIVGAIG